MEADHKGTHEQSLCEIIQEVDHVKKCFEQVCKESDQKSHIIATIIVNLRNGVTPEQVLEWWDCDGKAMLGLGADAPSTPEQE